MAPAVTIIIPTYNRGAIAYQTFDRINKLITGKNIELIIVNDYKKGTIHIPSHWPNTSVLNNTRSGAAAARNLGAANAKSDLLLFMDDDILLTESNLDRILHLASTNPNACFNLNWKYFQTQLLEAQKTSFGRFIIKEGLTTYRGCVPDLDWHQKGVFKVKKISAILFVISKELFLKTKGFDESFEKQGVEDDEFSERLKENNIDLYIDSENYFEHNEIDRLDLVSRLKRFKSGAYNKRVAFEMGLTSFYINYSLPKKIVYTLLLPFKSIIISIANKLPNKESWDFLYFKLSHLLIALIIFEGYYKKKTN